MGLLHEARNPSVWVGTAGTTDYPRATDGGDYDVVVVGGGITGLTTALELKRRGAKVAVVEAQRIASGTTGYTTGKVTSQHSVKYADLIDGQGERKARLYAEANQAAVAQVATYVEELGIDCDLTPADAYVYAQSGDGRSTLERETDAAQSLGLPASLVTAAELPFEVTAAMRFTGQAHIHARKYCLGLAEAVTGDGCAIFERSRVVDIDEKAAHVEVRVEEDVVLNAGHVVLATLLPIDLVSGFYARSQPKRSYGLALRCSSTVPQGMYINVESPTRSLRPVDLGDGPDLGLIVVGNSHTTGEDDDAAANYEDLERWARETFPVEAVEYRWSGQDYTTADSIPYVGWAPRRGRTLVATGFKGWGLSNGTAAATILADLIDGTEHPWLEVFDSTRIGTVDAIKTVVEDNLKVAKRLVRDRIGRLRAPDVAHLGPGEGAVVHVDGETVAAYRDENGHVTAVSATCTHLGCSLKFNEAETTWDCPCHGSRFTTDGEVICGPAVRMLERLDIQP
ncbi:MAG: FAD-dependent oxidoreductase [Acidimicrobiia bacterium]